MAVVKTNLHAWRKERVRAFRFTVVLFSLLAVAWPLAAFNLFGLGDDAVLEDVVISSWDNRIEVSSDGTETVTETVSIEFLKPNKYVRPVGELSSTTPSVRYFSTPVEAFIDGEPVDIDARYWGVGSKYYTLDRELEGSHEIVFTYEVKKALYNYKGKSLFRARLLPRYSLNEVDQFSSTILSPPRVEGSEVCWTSEAVKDPRDEDLCDFVEVSDREVQIDLEEIEYLRPVRFQMAVEGDFDSERLPWSASWDNVIGRNVLTPAALVIGLATMFLVFRRIGSRGHSQVIKSSAAASLALVIALATMGFIPSGLFLLLVPIWWHSASAYVSVTEGRLLAEIPVEEA